MLIKTFKQIVITICLVSILFSCPALAFASQNTEAHIPKGDLNITDKIHNSGNTSTIIGGNTIIDDTNFFEKQDFPYGLLVEPRYLSIGEIVSEIVFRTMPISIAIPIAAVLGVQEINHTPTSHKQENNISTKSLYRENINMF
jgi:hypothetical protein